MGVIEIPLGEFLPAFPKPKNPGCVVANNCIPAEGGYKPFPALVAGAEIFAGTCIGAELFFMNDGGPCIAGGTSTTLFIRKGPATTVTSGYNAVVSGEYWDFAQFNNFLFATSITNDPQYIVNFNAGSAFVPLPGTPPKAKYCERFGNFLMLGNITGAPNRIQWSAYNSPATSWAASRLTQAGFADLDPKLGEITGLSGGRYPLIFQERGVSLIQYVGPPTVWSITLVSEDRGLAAPFSTVTVGGQTYFQAQDGFWVTNGSSFEPIGSQRVNGWFLEIADNASLYKTQAAVDWKNKCIIWAFVSAQSVGGFDRALVYSWEQNRFSSASIMVDRLVGSRIDGVVLEGLDALFATLEVVTPGLDSNFWLAGDRVLAAFVTSGANTVYSTFNGAALQADWETGSFQPSPGKRAFITESQAVMEATDWVMQAATIALANDRTETASAYSSPGIAGFSPLRADGKEMRIAQRMPAGAVWDRAVGVQVTFRESGAR